MHMRIYRKTRREQQADTRKQLRHAARQEFASCGVRAASIDRISESAGFSRGAFYSNYSDKHELLLELLEDHQRREIEIWQSLLMAEGSLEDILPILQKRFDAFVENTDAFLFDFELRIHAMRDPAIAERYRVHFVTVCERTEALATTLIRRSGAIGISAGLVSMALRSFCPQLAVEHRLGLGDASQSPGMRLVKLLGDLFGIEQRPTAS